MIVIAFLLALILWALLDREGLQSAPGDFFGAIGAMLTSGRFWMGVAFLAAWYLVFNGYDWIKRWWRDNVK